MTDPVTDHLSRRTGGGNHHSHRKDHRTMTDRTIIEWCGCAPT